MIYLLSFLVYLQEISTLLYNGMALVSFFIFNTTITREMKWLIKV